MIDPDSIQTQSINLPNKITINNTEIPVCDIQCYCLEDDKEYEKFVRDIETNIRRSFEYKNMIFYLRNNMDMNKCAFLKGVTNEDTYDIKIEIHHYPFSLRDIVDIVIRKRQYYHESLTVQMVAKECMELHYKLLVGLIPLSKTVHELAHSARLFIPVDKVIGRYNLFISLYKPFCTPEQHDTIQRIEDYSMKQESSILNTNIIEQNKITYDIKDSNYILTDSTSINNAMITQLNNIKNNNYILPSVSEIKLLEDNKPNNNIRCPITFNKNLMKGDMKYDNDY
jgi:hypothetical protein